MTKAECITIRVDTETKQTIEQAARAKGKTMTTFLVESALKASKQAASPSGVHRGVPSFFRAACREAQRGGQGGYDRPAYELSRHLPGPYDLDFDEWAEELEDLKAMLMPTDPRDEGKQLKRMLPPDDGAVWAWFDSHYPKCMALIPTRRRSQFLAGVYRAVEDEIIALDQ